MESSKVNLIFVYNDGKEHIVSAPVGENLLCLTREFTDDLLGTCEGSLVCSTCHVILEKKLFKNVDPAEEEENDTMDMISNIKPTSRLSCQITVTDQMDGMKVFIPCPETGKIFTMDDSGGEDV